MFNKLLVNFINENYMTFIILFKTYKYRILLFDFINDLIIY